MDLDALLTAAQAARLLRVGPHTIHMWRQGRRITEVDRDANGARRYRWGDLLAVERDTRVQPRGRPRRRQPATC